MIEQQQNIYHYVLLCFVLNAILEIIHIILLLVPTYVMDKKCIILIYL